MALIKMLTKIFNMIKPPLNHQKIYRNFPSRRPQNKVFTLTVLAPRIQSRMAGHPPAVHASRVRDSKARAPLEASRCAHAASDANVIKRNALSSLNAAAFKIMLKTCEGHLRKNLIRVKKETNRSGTKIKSRTIQSSFYALTHEASGGAYELIANAARSSASPASPSHHSQ